MGNLLVFVAKSATATTSARALTGTATVTLILGRHLALVTVTAAVTGGVRYHALFISELVVDERVFIVILHLQKKQTKIICYFQ
jgi:hypothetical protein